MFYIIYASSRNSSNLVRFIFQHNIEQAAERLAPFPHNKITVGSNPPVCVHHRTLKTQLTFDLQEHELLVGHSAVVGHLLGDVDAAQVDVAEVLLAGQTSQSHVGEARVLIHCGEVNRQHTKFNQYIQPTNIDEATARA